VDKPIKIITTVDSVTYNKEKKQIANCFIENVEFYRQNPDLIDYSNKFAPYVECFNFEENKYQRTSYSAKQAIEVTTDAILYSKDKLFCFAFLVIKMNHIHPEKSIEERRDKGREYDAKAVIGYRENQKEAFRIYPVEEFSVIGYESYNSASETLKQLYFTKLKGVGGRTGSQYEGLKVQQNVGDKDFFELSPYFKKNKEGLYYFQLYMNAGKIYENNTCKCR
jgi:hypothetical protein